MNQRSVFTRAALLAPVLAMALWPTARAADAVGKPVTIHGYVLDSACAYVKDLKKPISKECAVACAKAGSPLAILTREGTIYLPISEAPTAAGQNDRLMEYAGQMVTVTGKAYVKGGSHAIVIDKVEAAPAGK